MDLVQQDLGQVDNWELMLLAAIDKISITEPQYSLIEKRYDVLQDILSGSDDPILQDAHIFIQGSICLKTTIKPAPEAKDEMATIDADAVVLLPRARGYSADEVLKSIKKIFSERSRVQSPIVELRRGIRIEYADENPAFHIDVTPAISTSVYCDPKGFGNLQVPDRVQGWKASTPRDYSDWLDELSKQQITIALESRTMMKGDAYDAIFSNVTQDPMPSYDDYTSHNPLRATIKVLKRLRDVWAISTEKTDQRPISAVITTLAALSYEAVVAASVIRPLRPLEAITMIIEGMPKFIKMNQATGEYFVLNPKDAGENFAEKWNRKGGHEYRQAFYEWHGFVMDALRIGLVQHTSELEFESNFSSRFGLPKAWVSDFIEKTLPSNKTLPGLKKGVTKNTLAIGLFSGGTAAQENITSVDRLG
ncbi:hypothetical protein WH43_07415 [Rheinheimera sp. KL1]|uniref:nucleotidyltransferase domain-containing protein n=1 Tax=Rheinheimera sp. KL1 TaxID=1635005 RepID=UPI0006A97E12|nr:nucleotidyltransferase [Rheinheimera sp. KL1]KOO58676.1 hypothetical protein WH43_07415 [Rheinheimera sp. KL1]